MTAREEVRLVALSENDRDALWIARRLASLAVEVEADQDGNLSGADLYQAVGECFRSGAGAAEARAVLLCLDAIAERYDAAEVVR